jgi:hypothetical protein
VNLLPAARHDSVRAELDPTKRVKRTTTILTSIVQQHRGVVSDSVRIFAHPDTILRHRWKGFTPPRGVSRSCSLATFRRKIRFLVRSDHGRSVSKTTKCPAG